jgi:hypothetical protein
MLFNSAELLFAAVTLLCSLLYLFPYARLIHEQLAAQERSAQSSDSVPVPAPDTNRAVNEETQLEMEDYTVALHHRGGVPLAYISIVPSSNFPRSFLKQRH